MDRQGETSDLMFQVKAIIPNHQNHPTEMKRIVMKCNITGTNTRIEDILTFYLIIFFIVFELVKSII